MRNKHIDNFAIWRDKMRQEGVLPEYKSPIKNGDLAELLGVVLGDGSIHKFERTEGLRIVANAKNIGFIKRYSVLVERVFNKKPNVSKRKTTNAVDIRIYQKFISQRLGISTGARAGLNIKIPCWILRKREYIVRYLRGLYEAEGSLCIHLPTYTHKLLFSNCNKSMLNNVEYLLRKLKFHPHKSKYQIQLSKKKEVYKAVELLEFREYCGII